MKKIYIKFLTAFIFCLFASSLFSKTIPDKLIDQSFSEIKLTYKKYSDSLVLRNKFFKELMFKQKKFLLNVFANSFNSGSSEAEKRALLGAEQAFSDFSHSLLFYLHDIRLQGLSKYFVHNSSWYFLLKQDYIKKYILTQKSSDSLKNFIDLAKETTKAIEQIVNNNRSPVTTPIFKGYQAATNYIYTLFLFLNDKKSLEDIREAFKALANRTKSSFEDKFYTGLNKTFFYGRTALEASYYLQWRELKEEKWRANRNFFNLKKRSQKRLYTKKYRKFKKLEKTLRRNIASNPQLKRLDNFLKKTDSFYNPSLKK